LAAVGEFHEMGSGYVLIKAAKTYTANRHEYVYFYSIPHLNLATYESCLARTRSLGEPRVEPVEGHMCTNIVMVVFCDTADADALEALKKCRIRKSFQFSFKGWMEVQTAAVEVGKAEITANFAGYNTAKFLKSVVDPKSVGKKRGLFR